MNRDKLFARCIVALVVILLFYGAGMMAAVLWGDEVLALKMLTGFSAMFAGTLGLLTGYLLGGK